MRSKSRLWSGGRLATSAFAVLTAFLLASSSQASAQGFGLGQLFGGSGGGNGGGNGNSSGGGGLSQLFGGGSGGGNGSRHQLSGQSDGSGISVERSAAPFNGKFTGQQDSQGMQSSITAQFACYPASDYDIPQAKAFVCYAGSNGGEHRGGPEGHAYGPPANGPPNGPPPDIE
jgi:hypothetical protein